MNELDEYIKISHVITRSTFDNCVIYRNSDNSSHKMKWEDLLENYTDLIEIHCYEVKQPGLWYYIKKDSIKDMSYLEDYVLHVQLTNNTKYNDEYYAFYISKHHDDIKSIVRDFKLKQILK